MKSLLTALLVMFGFTSMAQTYSQNNFIYYPIPKNRTDNQIDTSRYFFSVSIVDNLLQIEKMKNTSGKEYRLGAGKVLALDAGEWGGGLYYQPDDNSNRSYIVNGKRETGSDGLQNLRNFLMPNDPARELLKGNHFYLDGGRVKAAALYKKDLLTLWYFRNIEGISNSLKNVKMQKDSFYISKIFDFKTRALTMTVYKDKAFIITTDSFYVFENGKIDLVFTNHFLDNLYPNSIAVLDEQNIYVGMRSGYAKINLLKKGIEFFVYKKLL